MNESFYRRLFAGPVLWALHTTYTCDLGFVSALLEQQRQADPDDADQTDRTAVFYHSSGRILPTVRSLSKKWPLLAVKELLHPLKQGSQTFHAKISLVCCRGERGPQYRLAVLSRNLDTSPCRDLAMLFDLEVGGEKTDSGCQLTAYLEKLREATDPAGRKWLAAHLGEEEKARLSRVTLRAESGGKTADLFFGGLGGECSLGQRLQLDTAQPDSLVLTPPEFLRGGHLWNLFRDWNGNHTGPQLYDSVEPGSGSHCKLYLLHHGTRYALWAGSANATPHGLGWKEDGFSDGPGDASVECLVRFSLTQDEFTRLHREIEESDAPFSFAAGARGSLIVHPDLFGPWVCANYRVTGLRYQKSPACAGLPRRGQLVVTLKPADGAPARCPQVLPENRIWRPAEYDTPAPAAFTPTGEVTLTYPVQKFSPTQGVLLFGTSCAALWVPQELLRGLPQANAAPKKDTRLTDWLLSSSALDVVDPEEDFRPHDTDKLARRYYNILCGNPPEPSSAPVFPAQDSLAQEAAGPPGTLPSAAQAADILREQPLPFQKKAAARLVGILQRSSRAFLADEAGLGKTYSAAAAICTLAKTHWNARKENAAPLICLYVASNQALLAKCTHDFQSKAQGLLGNSGKVVVLKDRLCCKDALYLALVWWFLRQKSDGKDHPEEGPLLKEACTAAMTQWKKETETSLHKMGVRRFVRELRNVCFPGRDPHRKYLPKSFDDLDTVFTTIRSLQMDRLLHHELILGLLFGSKDPSGPQRRCRQNPDPPDRSERLLELVFGSRKPSDRLLSHRQKLALLLDDKALADRLLENEPMLNLTGRTLVLLPVTAACLLEEAHAAREKHWLLLLRNREESGQPDERTDTLRPEFTRRFLHNRQPLAVIWDEFHLYTPKLRKDNALYRCLEKWETESREGPIPMKSLFLSATPYRTNISGRENQAVLEDLYRTLQKDEREELTKLPSFADDFAPLFCAGSFALDQDLLCTRYQAFQNTPGDAAVRARLQRMLRTRMVRHERTQLQGEPELPRRLYPPRALDPGACAPVLRHTMVQCRALEQAGFTEGDRSWSLFLPWILSFFKESANTEDPRLNPSHKSLRDDPALFVYDKEGEPIPERLATLPRQSLPFYEICRETLRDRMEQLLWVPPTVPLYQPPDGSLFRQYRDYSKMLVFAEYRCYQRGGALLLSDYAKQRSTRVGKPLPDARFALHCVQKVQKYSFCLHQGDYRQLTLDELIRQVEDRYAVDTVTALALIASPAACAQALQFRDPAAVESAFNRYWNRDGVKQALWAWLCDNGYEAADQWEKGILRYCAEGNLYAVLEEWQFMTREHRDEDLKDLLREDASFARVEVQSLDSLTDQNVAGHRRFCSFADRLTGDVGDVNSGDNEEVISACARRFSSPFWPMVLFAGRGAQEGMDFHQYCLSIMHLTLPRGAVSFDQRNGRIDRFHSLLVRRRAAEQLAGLDCGGTTQALLSRLFSWLKTQRPGADPDDQLYPHWHIPGVNSRHHFLQLFPVWPFTREEIALQTCDAMLESYRRPFGTSAGAFTEYIDLRP